MSQDGVEQFFGKVVLDYRFSIEAKKSLQIACAKAGIEITPGEMSCIQKSRFVEFAGYASFMKYKIYPSAAPDKYKKETSTNRL